MFDAHFGLTNALCRFIVAANFLSFIFFRNADGDQYSLDLHGLHVNEALLVLEERLNRPGYTLIYGSPFSCHHFLISLHLISILRFSCICCRLILESTQVYICNNRQRDT
jgi:hypothetical protein